MAAALFGLHLLRSGGPGPALVSLRMAGRGQGSLFWSPPLQAL